MFYYLDWALIQLIQQSLSNDCLVIIYFLNSIYTLIVIQHIFTYVFWQSTKGSMKVSKL